MESTMKNTWVLDPVHSEIIFSAKHMMITNVKGEFKQFRVEVINASPDFAGATIRTVIDAGSVLTNSTDRDAHLKSADFFDTANFKEILFESTSFVNTGGTQYRLTGNLTIRGITREVSLDVEFGGIYKDPWGNEKAGFSVSGKVNRKDWGLNWNAALEAGGVLVSDEVKINAEVQFVRQA